MRVGSSQGVLSQRDRGTRSFVGELLRHLTEIGAVSPRTVGAAGLPLGEYGMPDSVREVIAGACRG